jgi:hypothetical protein
LTSLYRESSYLLLSAVDWFQTFLKILDLVFRDVPGRFPGEISLKLSSEEYILIDETGEIITSNNWRSYRKLRRMSAKLDFRLMGKENWNLIFHPTERQSSEEVKGSTLKERKDQYLKMLQEREERAETEARQWRDQRRQANKVPKRATVESDSDDSSAPSIRRGGDLTKRALNKRLARDRPSYEFYVTDDPHVPSQVLDEEEQVRTREKVDFQPALLWRGPASATTSSRARAAARTRTLTSQQPPSATETKLEESFVRSIDKSFSLELTEYQKAACCTNAEFKDTLSSWYERIRKAKSYEIPLDQSAGLRKVTLGIRLSELYGCFVPVEDESRLSQKYRSALLNIVKVSFTEPGPACSLYNSQIF